MRWLEKTKLHLKSQNETYIEHLVYATKISSLLILLAVKCFVHAIFPFLYVTAVSDNIKKIKCLTERTNK